VSSELLKNKCPQCKGECLNESNLNTPPKLCCMCRDSYWEQCCSPCQIKAKALGEKYKNVNDMG
jgi:hypothetical protein